MSSPRWRLRLRRAIHPGDRTILALLALSLAVALIRWPAVRAALTPLVLVQAMLLLGFLACAVVLARRETRRWVPVVRSVATVAVIFMLYTTLGKLGVVAMPYLADAALSRADGVLLGFDPSLALQRFQAPRTVEFFSFIYGARSQWT